MTTGEKIIDVLQKAAPRRLTANQIIEAGEFPCSSANVMGCLQRMSQPGGELERQKPDGIYTYGLRVMPKVSGEARVIRPLDGDKIDIHAPAKVESARPITAAEVPRILSQTFQYETPRQAAEYIMRIINDVGRTGYVWIRNDGRIKIGGEDYGAGPGETFVGTYQPKADIGALALDIAASHPANKATVGAVIKPRPEAVAQAVKEGRIPDPNKEPCPECGKPMTKGSKQCLECYEAKCRTARFKPPLAAKEEAKAPPALMAVSCNGEELADVDIDPILVGMVLRLPGGSERWTKEERAAWTAAFNSVADFLYPESA